MNIFTATKNRNRGFPINRIRINVRFQPFNAWYPLKRHTGLNRLSATGLFK